MTVNDDMTVAWYGRVALGKFFDVLFEIVAEVVEAYGVHYEYSLGPGADVIFASAETDEKDCHQNDPGAYFTVYVAENCHMSYLIGLQIYGFFSEFCIFVT